jgi:hypothetical protein
MRMKLKTLLGLAFLGLVAGAVAATAAEWPSIQRYMKIRAM